MNENAEKYYLKFEGKVEENRLTQLGYSSREKLQFENENSFGAINPINRDVQYSYAVVSSDLSSVDITEISKDLYVMPFFTTAANIELGISHLFTVKLKSNNDFPILDSIAKANKVKIVGNHTFRPLWYTLSCDIGSLGNALQMANTFYETKLFQYAIPDIMEEPQILELSPPPSDPLFSTQWNFLNTGQAGGTPNADVNITGAWGITKGSSNIVVAILDLGLQSNHPDLTNISPISYDADLGQSPAYCCLQHGMNVGGIIGANHNSIGIAGTSPNSPLMSIWNSNVSSPSIRKKWADAIDFAWQNGASIINCSWGFYIDYAEIEEAIDNATSYGRSNNGAIVVAAIGNDNTNDLQYPAAYPKTIAVGGTDRNDQRSSFSNYGNGLDIVAPATSVPTLAYNTNQNIPADNYTIFNGTSIATSQVSGIISLILSMDNDFTYLEVADILRRSAQKVGGYIYTPGQGHDPNLSWNNQMGFGRVDACMALIESFKMKSDVTGPDRICTTNTNFTLQNVPAGQTVTWAVSPTYLFPSTGRTGTGTTATLRAAGTSVSGAATLTYTVDTDCGEYQEYSFDSPPQRIRVFDLTGAERICVEDPPADSSYELDISHLQPGVYVVHLDHRNGTVTRQLRVE